MGCPPCRCAVAVALAGLTLLVGGLGCPADPPYLARSGDIVFQTSRSAQSDAIQRATRSRYSHVGIVVVRDGEPMVFEAVEPVRLTPLAEWIARGRGGHFVAKRLRHADRVLDASALRRMQEVGTPFLGRHYDLRFEWSDERLYCSELVWKIYHRALGLDLGRTRPMSSFDLSDPLVREAFGRRFAGSVPADEPVISPAEIFASGLLETVVQN